MQEVVQSYSSFLVVPFEYGVMVLLSITWLLVCNTIIIIIIFCIASCTVWDSLVITRSPFTLELSSICAKFFFRFVSLMGGHIWIGSEGTGRGCTATFVVKLGVCDNTNTYQQQLIPLVWPSSADSDLSAPKALPDGKVSASLKSRYQRSVWA